MKNKITHRLSLRAKFKSTQLVEVVIMDEDNNIQIEMIPVRLKQDIDDSDVNSKNEVASEVNEGGAK